MFGTQDKSKDLREQLLEKLIDHLMMTPDGKSDDEKSENPLEEALESPDEEAKEDASEVKPKLDLSIMKISAKPKKFTMPDGTEADDESLEDILKRKGLK